MHDDARRELDDEYRQQQVVDEFERRAGCGHRLLRRLKPQDGGVDDDERHDHALGFGSSTMVRSQAITVFPFCFAAIVG